MTAQLKKGQFINLAKFWVFVLLPISALKNAFVWLHMKSLRKFDNGGVLSLFSRSNIV